jgi:hypothetical protein
MGSASFHSSEDNVFLADGIARPLDPGRDQHLTTAGLLV